MDLRLSRLFFLICFTLLISGCTAITGYKSLLNSFEKNLQSPICDYSVVEDRLNSDDDPILWASQGGSLGRNCFDYNRSNELFDKAERHYKLDVDLRSSTTAIKDSISSISINENVNAYNGNFYEKTMLNTYKGLNFMALGDFSNARVEFNRAQERQRRAKEYFNKEIIDARKKNRKNKNYLQAEDIRTKKVIYDRYAELFSGLEVYPDFINPYVTYISAIFSILDMDYNKARGLLKYSTLMQPKNIQIKEDFKLIDELDGLRRKRDNYAWIIYENGQSIAKKEININIPLFLFTDKIYYAGLSLPTLYSRSGSYDYIEANGKKSRIIADMDSIIKAEFKKRFSQIALRATMNMVIKMYIQERAIKADSFLGFATLIYENLTNRADIRSWTALPKNFQSVRVKLDKKFVIIKDDRQKVIATLHVESKGDVLIYIKSSLRGYHKIHKIVEGRK